MDGGWGWMILVGAFISYFIADGWAYSFGILFEEMTEYFSESKGNTALVPTLLYGIPMVISPVVCAMTTVFGFRKVAIIGGCLTSMSMVLAAFSDSFSLFCLSIGLLSSIGFAMTYVPSIVALTCHFDRRRGLATGLAVTGSGLGSFAFPLFVGFLMEKYVWRGMLLIMGGVCLQLVVAGSLYRPVEEEAEDAHHLPENSHKRFIGADIGLSDLNSSDEHQCKAQAFVDAEQSDDETRITELREITNNVNTTNRKEITDFSNRSAPRESSVDPVVLRASFAVDFKRALTRFWHELQLIIAAMLDKSVLSNGPFLFFCAMNFITYLWVSVPYVYLVHRAILIGIDQDRANFLMSTVGIARTIGQVLFGIVGDLPRVSSNLLYGISVAAIGFSTILVPVCVDYTSLSIYSAVFGLFVSVTYVLPMMCLVESITLSKATNAFGFLQFVQGLGTLIGTPIAGFVFDKSGDYNVSFFIAGSWILFSGLLLCPMPCILRRTRREPLCTAV